MEERKELTYRAHAMVDDGETVIKAPGKSMIRGSGLSR